VPDPAVESTGATVASVLVDVAELSVEVVVDESPAPELEPSVDDSLEQAVIATVAVTRTDAQNERRDISVVYSECELCVCMCRPPSRRSSNPRTFRDVSRVPVSWM